jgi:predicted RNase H-like HicB family nuclease
LQLRRGIIVETLDDRIVPLQHTIQIPVLARFWHDDGVWNGSAVDIPVAAFGETFEEAQQNFEEALLSHFEVICEHGQESRVISRLLQAESLRNPAAQLPVKQPFVMFMVDTPQESCLAHA